MIDAAGSLMLAQADSARAVSAVYTVSLLATFPLAVAALAAFALRRANAEARTLVWRSAIVALLLAFVGRIPGHALAWVVPAILSAPLVALGRVQVTGTSVQSLGSAQDIGGLSTSFVVVRALFVVYVTGVILVLLPTIVASVRLRRRVARNCRPFDASCAQAEARRTLARRRPVRVVISPAVLVPLTWGIIRPVIVLPAAAQQWSQQELAIVLLHEMTHIRAGDWAFALAGRAVCALYWFHPGAWWIARGLHSDCELACDDRVIASGVRRSDYAELLVNAAEALRPSAPRANTALALSQRSGLRARLDALLDTRHRARPLSARWSASAAAITLVVAGSMSAVRIAPSREVLTTLMGDTRWESRAYAVLGLAQRQDSVAVARSAAELDPSPRVRAWARYALGEPAPLADPRSVVRN
jgi:beta-lactamase regulating signal transducer with metallopeptidase domain